MVVIISLLPIVAQQLLRSRDFIIIANNKEVATKKMREEETADLKIYGLFSMGIAGAII